MEYASITVIAADMDYSLLLRLSDSIGQLKQRVIQEIPSVAETLAADSNVSVQLGYDGRVPGNESRSCMQEGLRHHSHVFHLFENGLFDNCWIHASFQTMHATALLCIIILSSDVS